MAREGEAGSQMRVLVVDDEEAFRILMESELGRVGFSVECVKSGEEALGALAAQDFEVVLLDLKMPGLGGMETLKRMREAGVAAEVIILTGHPDIDDAIQAMKLGAYDYLTKPARLAEVEELLKRAAEKKELQRENVALKRMVAQKEGSALILGRSSAIRALLDTIKQIGPSDANVLIQGETGTGKGLVTRAIHQEGHRSARPFLALNCSAFQEPLLESELFGYERGAFTGATRTIRVNVRILAATNKDLAQEVRAGRFRQDLHYRLDVINVTVPPLRQRKEDIPLLIEHFLHQFRLPGRPVKAVSKEASAILVDYPWPGNVRELANTIERLVILSLGPVIGPDDLPLNVRTPQEALAEIDAPDLPLVEIERRHILRG